VTLKPDQNINYLPYVFAEQGVAILSSVLRSKRVVEVNSAVTRIFVQWRRLMHCNRSLARKVEIIEKRHHEQFAIVFDAIKELIAQDQTRKAQLKHHMAVY
jgi:ERCC4-type nuclease